MTEIEKGIPLPKRARVGGGPSTGSYPWQTMETGDSFVAPNRQWEALRAQAYRQGKATGRGFTVSKQDDGRIRVWRVS